MQYLAYPHYQKTNIDWLGDIPQHWGYRKLRYYSKRVATGTTPTGDIYFEDATENWFTPSDFDDRKLELNNSNRKINITAIENGEVKVFPAGSVLVIGIGATLGKIGMSKADFSCNQQINIIIPDDILDARFLAYSLQVKIEVMKIISNSTTIGIMNQDKTKLIDICAPHLEEQKKIAFFLDYKTRQIDQLIEKKKELIEKLEEQRIAVITQAVTKGIDKNAKLKPSGVDWLGDVPEHWDVRRLKFMASIQNGRDYKDVEVEEGGYPVYGSGGEFRRSNQYLYEGESVLFGRKGTIDKPLYVNCRFWTVDTMFYSEILANTVAKFLYYSALTFQYQKLATQTALPSITQHDLENYTLTYPCKAEQILIVNYLDEQSRKIKEMITVSKEAIGKLEEYRSAIITSAVTGKIDVRAIGIPKEVV